MRSSCFLVGIMALLCCCKSCFGFSTTTKHLTSTTSSAIRRMMATKKEDVAQTKLFGSSSDEETNSCEFALVAADGLPSSSSSGMRPLVEENENPTASVEGTSASSTKLQQPQSSPVDFALLGSMACLAAILTLAWVATDSPLVQDIEDDGSAATFIVDAVFASLATIVSLASGNDVTE